MNINAKAEADKLIERFGRGVTDMFEQMLKGNWVDDHGHAVSMNKQMMELRPIVEAAIEYRAANHVLIEPEPKPPTASGSLSGEDRQEALGWAAWCERRGMGMLEKFLRRITS